MHGHAAVVERLLSDPRVDPSADGNAAIAYAVEGGFDAFERLLLDERVDPAALSNRALRRALGATPCQHRVVDRLLSDARVFRSLDSDIPRWITHVGMVRSRFGLVCVALQDLGLPALVTLEILDALLPNAIRMAAKWDLVVAVKHHHDRRPHRTKLES